MNVTIRLNHQHPAVDQLIAAIHAANNTGLLFDLEQTVNFAGAPLFFCQSYDCDILSWWVDLVLRWPDAAHMITLGIRVQSRADLLNYTTLHAVRRLDRTSVIAYGRSWIVQGLTWSAGKALVKAHDLSLAHGSEFGKYTATYNRIVEAQR